MQSSRQRCYLFRICLPFLFMFGRRQFSWRRQWQWQWQWTWLWLWLSKGCSCSAALSSLCLSVSLSERVARPSSGYAGVEVELDLGLSSDHVIRVPAKRKIKEIQATAARCRCKLTFDCLNSNARNAGQTIASQVMKTVFTQKQRDEKMLSFWHTSNQKHPPSLSCKYFSCKNALAFVLYLELKRFKLLPSCSCHLAKTL